jgi:hypothetical protein
MIERWFSRESIIFFIAVGLFSTGGVLGLSLTQTI